jgi:hypothetical protein
MRHEKQLLKLMADLGYTKPEDQSVEEFMNKKATRLYKNPKTHEFKQFLDRHTSLLPNDTDSRQRWYYFRNSETQPHLCPTCDKFIASDYHDKYCCHKCSTLAPSTGAKRGPKVDLEAKSEAVRSGLKADRPDYKLVEYGRRQSTFKHRCGSIFQMGNRTLLEFSGSCSCEHKKLVLHDKSTLQKWHDEHRTGFTVLKYDHTIIGNDEAKLCCNTCDHKFVTRKQYDRRCPRCFPNLFVSHVWTDAEYRLWLRTNKPEFKLIDSFVDHRTTVEYRHKDCGLTFTKTPSSVTRASFRCPACAPATCGSYRTIEKDGREIRLRGKEHIALDWILKHDKFDLDDLEFDADGTVPKIDYLQENGAYRNTTRYYKPDMYVSKKNLLIEVKDFRTLGLEHVFFYKTAAELWTINCAKAKACLDKGFKFRMMLFNRDNERVRLPVKWYYYTHKQIKVWLAERVDRA